MVAVGTMPIDDLASIDSRLSEEARTKMMQAFKSLSC